MVVGDWGWLWRSECYQELLDLPYFCEEISSLPVRRIELVEQ